MHHSSVSPHRGVGQTPHAAVSDCLSEAALTPSQREAVACLGSTGSNCKDFARLFRSRAQVPQRDSAGPTRRPTPGGSRGPGSTEDPGPRIPSTTSATEPLHRPTAHHRKEITVIYRPGNTVPVSGIYSVVNSLGSYMGRQVTSEEGETFPAVVTARGEYGFVLYQQTQHLG